MATFQAFLKSNTSFDKTFALVSQVRNLMVTLKLAKSVSVNLIYQGQNFHTSHTLEKQHRLTLRRKCTTELQYTHRVIAEHPEVKSRYIFSFMANQKLN